MRKVYLLVLFVILLIPTFPFTSSAASTGNMVFTTSYQGSIPWGGLEFEFRTGHLGLGLDLAGGLLYNSYLGNIVGSRAIVFVRGYFIPNEPAFNGFVGVNSGADVFIGIDTPDVVIAIDSSITLGLEVRLASFVGRLEAGYNPVYLFDDSDSYFVHSFMTKLGLGFSF